jgi:hypothetical protein
MANIQNDTTINQENFQKKKTRGPTKKTKFPLPAGHTSFDYHIKVLKALNVASNKGTNFTSFLDVAPVASIHNNTVSKVLKFFYDIGIIDRGKRGTYKPKPELVYFFNELEWNESGAGKHFGKFIINTWFGEYALQLFKMNKEINKEDLIKNIGKYSLADQSNHAELLILVKFLEYGKIIEIDEKSGKCRLIYDIESSTKIELPPEGAKQTSEGGERIGIEISKVKRETPSHDHDKKKLTDKPKTIDEESGLQKGMIQLPGGVLALQVNVSINEDTDVEIIREKIIRLKQLLQ